MKLKNGKLYFEDGENNPNTQIGFVHSMDNQISKIWINFLNQRDAIEEEYINKGVEFFNDPEYKARVDSLYEEVYNEIEKCYKRCRQQGLDNLFVDDLFNIYKPVIRERRAARYDGQRLSAGLFECGNKRSR